MIICCGLWRCLDLMLYNQSNAWNINISCADQQTATFKWKDDGYICKVTEGSRGQVKGYTETSRG